MSLSLDNALQWLLSPLSGASTHHLDSWVVWHARSMVLAWVILLPVGALAARYFKVTPKQDWPNVIDNRAWWHAHRVLQYSGVVLMLVGASLAWWNESKSSSTAALVHNYLGWSVISLGVLQVLGGWFRGSKGGPTEPQMRGDHYDMTQHRMWFEWIHKTAGWIAIGIAVLTVALGLWIADAPKWMLLVIAAWWTMLFAYGMRLERAGRCIDTYQAIWGADSNHPGNQQKSNGWGMLRYKDAREKI
jgi:hypothetical protein